MLKKLFSIAIAFAAMTACGASGASDAGANTDNDTTATMTQATATDTASARVLVKTTKGDFTVLLYGDTPKHRDNFVKLAREGYYDSTLFHRVIKQFMVQAGDPDSKTATAGQRLGSGGPDYTLDAEIVFPKHFHKRGALAAARQGDQVNPMKRSSGSQFYVVTGKRVAPAEMAQMEQYMVNQQMQTVFNNLAASHRDEIMAMQRAGDRAGLKALQDKLIAQTEAEVKAHPVTITEEMKQTYTSIGGTPHLDNAYTVFGEVIEGMEVIDSIEQVATNSDDRPKEDVRILSMQVLK